MSALQELIGQISDPVLRERIQSEFEKLNQNKKFGLVFEEHLPEVTALYDVPISVGCTVMKKDNGKDRTLYTVTEINGEEAVCADRDGEGEPKIFRTDEIVRAAEFGQPIYPYLQKVDSVCNAPDDSLWHTLIEADNYHALQLLGRMIRTPMQHRIQDDETLNDVHLFLPHFDRDTVQKVVDDLQSEEGGEIPADVESETPDNKAYSMLTVNPKKKAKGYKHGPYVPKQTQGQMSIFASDDEEEQIAVSPSVLSDTEPYIAENGGLSIGEIRPSPESADNKKPNPQKRSGNSHTDTLSAGRERPKQTYRSQTAPVSFSPPAEEESVIPDESVSSETDGIDRQGIIDFINGLGLLSYDVRKTKVNDYLKSVFDMTHLLDQHGISDEGVNETDDATHEIVTIMHNYIERLKAEGEYEELSEKVKRFELKMQIFDVFDGSAVNDTELNLFTTTESDIDRQFRYADELLGNNGINTAYAKEYSVIGDHLTYKIDVILVATSAECLDRINAFAKDRFHELDDKYRRIVAIKCHERERDEYDKIVRYGDDISKHSFRLPETIPLKEEGDECDDHLYVNSDTGTVRIKLNSWEKAVLDEERAKDDFVCWIRNPQRSTKYGWALAIPYVSDGETKAMYPDFLIVRRDDRLGYIVDILEPHGPQYGDGPAKAKGMAEYAAGNKAIGRVQIAREAKGPGGQKRFKRIDLSERNVNETVRKSGGTPDDLTYIFDRYGYFM